MFFAILLSACAIVADMLSFIPKNILIAALVLSSILSFQAGAKGNPIFAKSKAVKCPSSREIYPYYLGTNGYYRISNPSSTCRMKARIVATIDCSGNGIPTSWTVNLGVRQTKMIYASTGGSICWDYGYDRKGLNFKGEPSVTGSFYK